jgi:hypothetical protein
MKSERPDLPLTIARLVRSATPVARLDPPSVRLLRWLATSTALAGLIVVLLGGRADVAQQMVNPWFLGRAAATLLLALAAAFVALSMSVPGLELSRRGWAFTFSACVVWAQFVCANDGAAHHLVWHFAPVVLLAAAGSPVVASLLDWPSRRPGGEF